MWKGDLCPPNSYVEILTLKVIRKGGALWEVIRS